MAGYYLGLDVGTTLITAVLTDENWHVVAKASKAHRTYYPNPGWVEQDPVELLGRVVFLAVANQGMKGTQRQGGSS